MAEQGTISLYLDLEEGEKADLEVVARASLAWAAVIREMAAMLDPMSEVRIELTSGTEGSLSLNSVVRYLRSALPGRHASTALIAAVLLWVGHKSEDWTFNKVLDALTSGKHPEATKGLTPAEIHDLAQQIAVTLRPTVAEQPKRQLFRELERDPVIKGVGATEDAGTRPTHLIPRSEFPERAGEEIAGEEGIERRRTIITELRVVLVSPVLKDAERRWRFQPAGLPEFGATMKDHDFLDALRAGRIDVPLRPGIEMTIELQTKEEMEGGVWEPKERSVTKVLSPAGARELRLPTD